MGKSVKPLFVSLFLVAAALSPLLADSAQDTLEQFLGAMAAMDFSQEYSFLSSEDHRAMSEQEYIETVHQFDLGIERSKDRKNCPSRSMISSPKRSSNIKSVPLAGRETNRSSMLSSIL